MAPSKKQILEDLAEVKHVGPALAEQLYDELELRSVQDIVDAAERKDLQQVKGIGAATEKKILGAARERASAAPQPRTPADKKEKGGSETRESKKTAGRPTTSKRKTNGARDRRSQSSGYRPPDRDSRPSIPGLLFKLTKKIIGRLLR